MPDNVQSAMLEILKRIQSDVSDVKSRLGSVEDRLGSVEDRLGSVEDRLGSVESRLERVEAVAKRQRRDSAAMLVMMRGVVGVFDERVSDLEEDVRAILERG